jgi:ketosteroid isomerase-like protein
LELVRSIYEAWERGDFSSSEWADDDIRLVIADGAEPASYRGLAAMAGAWREVLAAWEDLRVEAEEYRELDDERVLVLTRNTGRGKTSGLELGRMHTRGANVFVIGAGKVTRLVAYWNRERALADLGLAP